jgi:CRP-like cAMP-binding protein
MVLHLPPDTFDRLADRYPGVRTGALKMLAARFAARSDRLEDLALYDVPTRLARDLLHLARQRGDRVIPLTQQQLASRIGASRCDITRAFRGLRQDGIVRSHRGQRGLVVLDLERLTARAQVSS